MKCDDAPLVLLRAQAMEDRARRLIPGVTQTISKRPEAFVPVEFPHFIDHAQGAHVWDVDGNEYVDYVMACGPVTLGYCYPEVDRAILQQLAKGIIFTRLTSLEAEVAELVCHVVPCAEMVRFFKGGAEANSAAMRIARAFTGREMVVSCGYRGWHDQWAVTHSPLGIPGCLGGVTKTFDYNSLSSLSAVLESNPGRVAAVIIDPVSGVRPEPGFLEGVQTLARQHGALLVFDEIVTGFRLAPGGAQEYFGVVPDMAVFAKGIANGMPLSAVVGRRDVMEYAQKVFVTLTYGDEALSLAAAKATLGRVAEGSVCPHIWEIGRSLVAGIGPILQEMDVPFTFSGVEAMPAFVAAPTATGRPMSEDDQQRAWLYLLRGLARRSVIWRKHSLILPSFSHTPEDVELTLVAFRQVCEELAALLKSGTLAREIDVVGLPTGFRRV